MTGMLNRIVVAATLLMGTAITEAGVTRVVVEHRESPAFGGQTYGKAGQYEIWTGHFYGEIDPSEPRNAMINDIQFAPRNARGKVEYSATLPSLNRSICPNRMVFFTTPFRIAGAELR
jgi:hypothetical protein